MPKDIAGVTKIVEIREELVRMTTWKSDLPIKLANECVYETPNGAKLTILEFKSFDDLSEYWIKSFDAFKEQKLKTKVIGKRLIIF